MSCGKSSERTCMGFRGFNEVVLYCSIFDVQLRMMKMMSLMTPNPITASMLSLGFRVRSNFGDTLTTAEAPTAQPYHFHYNGQFYHKQC